MQGPGIFGLIVAEQVVVFGPGDGLFVYNGQPSLDNPPVWWAVAPGVTMDPYGNALPSGVVMGAGTPNGAGTTIDDSGDVTLTGGDGSQILMLTGAGLPVALTSALTGLIDSAMLLATNDPNEAAAGIVSDIVLGTGSTAQMGTLIMSPFGTTGTGMILLAENDGSTNTAGIVFGSVTLQSGTLTFLPIMYLTSYALVLYGGTSTINVVTKTSGSGTITGLPAAVDAQAWANGGNGGSGAIRQPGPGGAGGGGAEWADEPALATSGSVTYSVGGHGAVTTITGSAVTVTAHPGGDGGNSGGTPGAAGTGSTNTNHQNGTAGSAAGATTGGDGGAGAKGGAGGKGGASGSEGAAGTAPGGGGGGSGGDSAGADGAAGQIRVTYSTGTPPVLFSVATVAGTDPFGTSYNANAHVTGADGNVYTAGHVLHWLTSDTSTIDSLTPAPLPGISFDVAEQSYHVRGMIVVKQGSVAANQGIQFAGAAVSFMEIAYFSVEGGTIFNSGVASSIGGNMATGLITSGTTGELHFDGIISFSASGTVGLDVVCITSATDTWVAGAGSYMEMTLAN
jgi:hypothetical protein